MRFAPKTAGLLVLLCLVGIRTVGAESQAAPSATAGAEQVTGRSVSGVNTNAFIFDGGSLRKFIAAFKLTFGVDLEKEATVDETMWNMRLPRMRVPTHGAAADWEMVLRVYNRMSEQADNRFGKWVLARGGSDGSFLPPGEPYTPPNAVLFIAPRNRQQQGRLLVKAFAVQELAGEDREQMLTTIETEVRRLRDISLNVPGFSALATEDDLFGVSNYHEQGGILVVSGAPAYVECASSIIGAYKEKSAKALRTLLPQPEDSSQKPAPAK